MCVLNGCNDSQSGFTPLEDYEDEYEAFGSFDVRELGEQIDGYWSYYEENEKQKELREQELKKWNPEYLEPGEYTVGKDIPAGLYICKTGLGAEDFAIVKYEKLEDGSDRQVYRFVSEFYILLEPGGVLSINENTKIAFASDTAPSLSAEMDGIYYSGSYKVGEEIPRGEYFMLSFELEYGITLLYKDGDEIVDGVDHFGHIVIEDAQIINLEKGVLIPMDKKPDVHPIWYQGEGEGKGKQVYSEGIYKIGVDIPLGTYKMKNELFRSVTDLSYKGYHGNESYYPRTANRAGIRAEEDEDAKHLNWWYMELDCHINSEVRHLKIHSLKADVEDRFLTFKGLPTVTFTEKDAGCQIRVINCVLIPEDLPEKNVAP